MAFCVASRVLLLLLALVPFCVGLDFTCPPLAVPLGSTATFNCSDPSTSGFDVKSSLLPHDIPIFGNAPEGHTASAGNFTVTVVEKNSSFLLISITFNVTLELLNSEVMCTSFRNGHQKTCTIGYPMPKLDPLAFVLCKRREDRKNVCLLSSISWNCPAIGLPLESVVVELNAEADVVKNNGTPCLIRFDEVTSSTPLNVSITGQYFTNYSSFVSVALDLVSPFKVIFNDSEDYTIFVCDLMMKENTIGSLIKVELMGSDNRTMITYHDPAPIVIYINRTSSLDYVIWANFTYDGITVSYMQEGRYLLNSTSNTSSTSGGSLRSADQSMIVILLLTVSIFITSSFV